MIIYFANRKMEILGHATTNLPEGLTILEDLKVEEVDTGVATFSCRVGFTKENPESFTKSDWLNKTKLVSLRLVHGNEAGHRPFTEPQVWLWFLGAVFTHQVYYVDSR